MKKLMLIASFAFALLGGAGHALAAPVTVNIAFTGTVTDVFDYDSAGIIGYSVGQSFGGTLKIGPMSETPDDFPAGSGFWQAGQAGAVLGLSPISGAGTGTIDVQSAKGPPSDRGSVGFRFNGPSGSFRLDFSADSPTATPLSSWKDLPIDLAAVIAYLGGTFDSATGSFGGVIATHPFGVNFTVDSFTSVVTPIPAALPLLLSALGGLGFFGWRQRAKTTRG